MSSVFLYIDLLGSCFLKLEAFEAVIFPFSYNKKRKCMVRLSKIAIIQYFNTSHQFLYPTQDFIRSVTSCLMYNFHFHNLQKRRKSQTLYLSQTVSFLRLSSPVKATEQDSGRQAEQEDTRITNHIQVTGGELSPPWQGGLCENRNKKCGSPRELTGYRPSLSPLSPVCLFASLCPGDKTAVLHESLLFQVSGAAVWMTYCHFVAITLKTYLVWMKVSLRQVWLNDFAHTLLKIKGSRLQCHALKETGQFLMCQKKEHTDPYQIKINTLQFRHHSLDKE